MPTTIDGEEEAQQSEELVEKHIGCDQRTLGLSSSKGHHLPSALSKNT
jgi:hypothetical protein